jgi:hypothetical protein
MLYYGNHAVIKNVTKKVKQIMKLFQSQYSIKKVSDWGYNVIDNNTGADMWDVSTDRNIFTKFEAEQFIKRIKAKYTYPGEMTFNFLLMIIYSPIIFMVVYGLFSHIVK